MKMKHWQDPANAVVGAWFVVSPWVLGFAAHTGASAVSVIAGVALVATALGATFVPRAWEEWTEAVLGLVMTVSPWLLGFSTLPGATANAVLAGLVVLALAVWVLAIDKDYGGWWNDLMAP
jgi:hypothetical protein